MATKPQSSSGESDILHCDTIDGLRQIEANSIDAIISDIPYGIGAEDWDVLHSNTNSALRGSSPAQERTGAIFKSRGKPINGWSDADRAIPREYQDWCATWSSEWLRVLKPGASAIVFAGRRFAHRCAVAFEDAGFSLKDNLAWLRERAPHRAQRLSIVFERRKNLQAAQQWEGWRLGNLRPTFEPIMWFTKPYKVGTTIADNVLHYGVGGYNEDEFKRQNGSVDNVIRASFSSGEAGLHPTQKPVQLMQTLAALVSSPGQIILDPFCGSGTTLIAAKNIGRRYLGIERDRNYVEIARARLSATLF